MKKYFISLAVLTVTAAAIVAMFSLGGSGSCFDANVEALAAGEGSVVTLPCVKATSICYFTVKDASGNYYTASAAGLRNV